MSLESGCFLYRSRTALNARSSDFQAILIAARRRNQELGLTGYLHYEDGHFYQWLEGPAEALAQVAALVEADPRHTHIEYLWRGTQAWRQFAGWDMGYGSSAPGTLFDWVAEREVHVSDRAEFARAVLGFMLEMSGYGAATKAATSEG